MFMLRILEVQMGIFRWWLDLLENSGKVQSGVLPSFPVEDTVNRMWQLGLNLSKTQNAIAHALKPKRLVRSEVHHLDDGDHYVFHANFGR
jgi:hypothetical protein